jgi:hypothetical protein
MLVFATGRATRLASARYLLVDVADASLATIDIGLLAAGPLWRLGRGMAYGVREGRLSRPARPQPAQPPCPRDRGGAG